MEALRITVRVKPGSSRTKVGGAYGDDRQLVVAVNAPPVDGAANEAAVEALADALGLRRRDISVISGHTGRTKVIGVDTDDPTTLRSRLEELLQN